MSKVKKYGMYYLVAGIGYGVYKHYSTPGATWGTTDWVNKAKEVALWPGYLAGVLS